MAKTKSPLLSLDATGTINDSITFRKKLPGHTVSKYSKPGSKIPFESSPRQKDQRSIIRLITIHWQCMSSSDKLSWETAAKENRFKGTGYHYFLHIAQTDLTKYLSLVGYWTFNYHVGELVYDLSNNKNHGTLKPSYPANCPVFVDSINKKLGKAGSFDGIDDLVEVPNDPTLNFGTGSFTVECWVKPVAFVSPYAGIVTHRGVGRYWMLSGKDANIIYWYLHDSTNPALINVLVSMNIWHHFVGVVDRENDLSKLYIDTVKYTLSIAGFGTFDAPDAPVRIGHEVANDSYTKGLIDEVRIYNRALSEEEIKKHYSI